MPTPGLCARRLTSYAQKEDILRLARDEDDKLPRVDVPRDQETKLISRMITIWAALERLGVTDVRIQEAIRAVRAVELDDVIDWVRRSTCLGPHHF